MSNRLRRFLRCAVAAIAFALALLAARSLVAGDFIPLPEFADHKIPDTPQAAVRAGWRAYLDVAALAAGLGLASWLALRARSRRGLFVLAIAALAWLGFWREGCICPIGAIQNVSLAVCDSTYVIPWTVLAFFTLPLAFTLFFGRTFCAAVCPLGAIQELVAVRPVRVPKWLDQALGLLGFVYLGLAVTLVASGAAFLICRYDPFVAFFRRNGSVNMLIFGACFLLVGVFLARPYCRFFCPYGAILGLLSKVSRQHVRIPPKECIRCRLCEDVCPYNAIRGPTLATLAQRQAGRRRLAIMLVLAPVLVAAGFGLGWLLEAPLARLHPTVRLAERIYLEDTGRVEGTIDASDAFRNTGAEKGDLYREARALTNRFGWAGGFFGAWVGLVAGVKLVQLSVRRRRDEYQPDPAKCVSCGRCFRYCPMEQLRLGLITEGQLPIVPTQNSASAGQVPQPQRSEMVR